jgi:hypothetical protein
MRLGRIVGAVVLVALVVAGVLVYRKFSMPALPAAEPVTRVVSLDQGWSPQEAARYHYTAQGTLLMPLAWLEVMDAGAFTNRKLTDPDILAGFRYIVDGVRPDPSTNRTGLPIGWAVKAWPSPQPARGGPAPPPVQKVGFSCATCHTGQLNYKGVGIRIEGGGSMIDAGSFEDMVGKAVIATDLLPWKRSPFVAEVSRRTGLPAEVISKELTAARRRSVDEAMQSLVTPLYAHEGYGRLDALQRIANTLFAVDLHEPDNFRRGDGAVKYPYIWDIGRLDWVQYNGSVRQPMMRNVGEALGVRAETAFISDLTGKPNAEPVRWNSSVQVDALDWMEASMHQLRAPAWPTEVLGPLDAGKVARGAQLFQANCEGCHGVHVVRNAAQSEWRVTRIPLAKIGTDPQAAMNFASRTYDGAKLGAGTLSGGEGLKLVTDKVKGYQYDRLGLTAEQRASWDGFGRPGEVEAFQGYKARPLIGIWASPPYLHNGSVPTLYDLLSPVRPAKFAVGSREYDPVKVGFATRPVAHGGELDTSVKGSSNLGHWFAGDDRPGRIGRALSEDERWALVEYLKSATYETYPCRVMGGGPQPTAEECHRRAPAG